MAHPFPQLACLGILGVCMCLSALSDVCVCKAIKLQPQGTAGLGENAQVPRLVGEGGVRGHSTPCSLNYRIPKAQLPLAHASKACGEDESIASEDSPHGPHPFMGRKPFLGEQGEKRVKCIQRTEGREEEEEDEEEGHSSLS